MAIEGGARCGYVNPDEVTFDYLKGRVHAPGESCSVRVDCGRGLASDGDAVVDDEVVFDAAMIAPTVTWGITPGQGIQIDEHIPALRRWTPANA